MTRDLQGHRNTHIHTHIHTHMHTHSHSHAHIIDKLPTHCTSQLYIHTHTGTSTYKHTHMHTNSPYNNFLPTVELHTAHHCHSLTLTHTRSCTQLNARKDPWLSYSPLIHSTLVSTPGQLSKGWQLEERLQVSFHSAVLWRIGCGLTHEHHGSSR